MKGSAGLGGSSEQVVDIGLAVLLLSKVLRPPRTILSNVNLAIGCQAEGSTAQLAMWFRFQFPRRIIRSTTFHRDLLVKSCHPGHD